MGRSRRENGGTQRFLVLVIESCCERRGFGMIHLMRSWKGVASEGKSAVINGIRNGKAVANGGAREWWAKAFPLPLKAKAMVRIDNAGGRAVAVTTMGNWEGGG
jgi:hypothetical protein